MSDPLEVEMAHAAERAAYDAREDALEAEATTPRKKRKSSTSPTQRTLAEFKKLGYPAQVVERWNQYARVRVDLFGVIDVVAIATSYSGPGAILGVQACSGTDHAKRRAKILAENRARLWVEAGGRLELWSWSKRGDRGKRKTWTLRVEEFTADRWGVEATRAEVEAR